MTNLIPYTEATTLVASHKSRVQKMEAYFQSLDKTDDNALANFVSAITKAVADMKDKRMPMTKVLDDFKKQFTTAEATAEALRQEAVNLRNKLAAEALAAERIRMEDERRKIEEQQKAIDAKKTITDAINNFVIDTATTLKQNMLKALSEVTDANYDAKLSGLQKMPTNLPPEKYYTFTLAGFDKKEIDNALDTHKDRLFEYFKKEIETYRQECILHMASIKTMKSEDRAQIITAGINDISNEGAAAKEIEAVKTDMSAHAESQDVILSNLPVDSDVKGAISYTIEVTNHAAYKALVAYWFEVCFATFTGNIETKTVKSMIGDLEAYAKKTGEFLNVTGMKYNEVVKVRNKMEK